jgi:hypothetical protein
MPCGGDVHVAVVSFSWVLDDAAPAAVWAGAVDEAEFPVGISMEVKAYDGIRIIPSRSETSPPARYAVSERDEDVPTRNFLRQGRRRAFHLYQVLRKGDI